MLKKILLSLVLACVVNAGDLTLSRDNTLILNGPITRASVSSLIERGREIDSISKSEYPIYLFINSPGGRIGPGLELVDFLSSINRPVHTITLRSISMGWQIVQHLGKRFILRYGTMMSHKAFGTI